MIPEPLLLLIVEDEAAHVEAIRRAFVTADLKTDLRVVGTLREYREQVAAQPPDLALVDLNLPDGRAMEILTLPPEDAPFPVLVMTAYGNQQIVVEVLKAGALDYVVKSPESFVALPHTVETALREWKLRQSHRRAEAALRQSEERYRTILRTALAGFWLVDLQGRLLEVNAAYCRMSGYSEAELLARRIADLEVNDTHADIAGRIQKTMTQGDNRFESRHRRKDGTIFDVEVSVQYWPSEDRRLVVFLQDISVRKQAQAALRTSAAHLRATLESTADGILAVDNQGKLLQSNQRFAELWRIPQPLLQAGDDQAMLNFVLSQLTDPDAFLEKVQSIYVSDAESSDVIPFQDGRVFERYSVPMIMDGTPIGRVWHFKDITERRQAEADREMGLEILQVLNEPLDLPASIQRLVAILKARTGFAAVGVRLRAGEDFPYFSQAGFSKDFLQTENSLLGRAADGGLCRDKDGKVKLECTCGLVLSGQTNSAVLPFTKGGSLWTNDSLPLLKIPPTGDPRHHPRNHCVHHGYASVALVPIRNQNEIVGLLQFNDRRPGRFSLHSIERLENIAAHIGAALTRKQAELALQAANKSLNASRLLALDLINDTVAAKERTEQTLAALQLEVAERQQAEQHVRAQAELLDLAQDAIAVRNLSGVVQYWNKSCERLTGWSAAETVGQPFDAAALVSRAVFDRTLAVLLDKGSWSGELELQRKDGRPLTIMSRWTLVRDAQGQPLSVLLIDTDITGQKKMEAQLLRAQRVEGIGALASGIAHDLNNFLAPILMTTPILRDEASDAKSRELLHTVENCAQRATDIVRQLLTFTRGTSGAHVPLSLHHLLRDMGKIIRETFPCEIRPNVSASEDLWPVLGDVTHLHQALLNLCINARDAMPDGGTLTLTARNVTVDEAFAARPPGIQPGPFLCVSVSDTGTGIAPENLDRIFDPFFTTKEIGQGTGLGLASVLNIVNGHAGFLQVASQLGQGTTFELFFPAAPQSQTKPPTSLAPPLPHDPGDLILVVDDETSMCNVVRFTLERNGYRVVTATDGDQGMAVFLRQRAEIKAVIIDMMMPVMNGPTMIVALQALDPSVIILGMSGMLDRAQVKGLDNLKLAAYLTKPFSGAEMLRVLHATLQRPGTPATTKEAK